MADLTPQELDEITFLTGVDPSGNIANDTYFTYSGIAVTNRVYLNKWNNDDNGNPLASSSVAGTSGGTVTYGFSPDLGPQAQAAYASGLKLWSDIANIKFKQISDPNKANIQFTPAINTNGYTEIPSNGYRTPGIGQKDLPSQNSPNAKSGQDQIALEGNDNQFNNSDPANSFQYSNVIHEEGHVLGLGHAGAYNGTAQPDDQRSPYDTQAYSIMSYIPPDNTSFKFSDQSPIPEAVWAGGLAQTPMSLDIDAIQRIYGVSQSSTFSGGQTYGFNNNIVGSSGQYYDFSVNRNPILTLYNTGTNNKLDLSGFSTDANVNLNPGTFSSASSDGQLRDNIAISRNTRIDNAVGGSGNDTFHTNGNGDTIDGGAGYDTVVLSADKADYSINIKAGGEIDVVNIPTGAIDKLTNIESIQFAQAPVCFTSGALIRTSRGDVAVEDLRIDDQAVTASGKFRPIVWIMRREVTCTPSSTPVRILANAFGAGRPSRDLYLSPGHPVLVGADCIDEGGVLVPIMFLINGTTIVHAPRLAVTYWHIELDSHDILMAEGLPVESYFDGGDRNFFKEPLGHTFHGLDFAPSSSIRRCRPVMTDGPLVESERKRLSHIFSDFLNQHSCWTTALEFYAHNSFIY